MQDFTSASLLLHLSFDSFDQKICWFGVTGVLHLPNCK